ncbi:MAG TPA: aminotransferase class V-fold PLP-dependent enzyme [Bacilli bacterium]
MPIQVDQFPAVETTEYDWEAIRAQFNLNPEYVHLGASQFIASHPKPVREAIARHRDALDYDPVLYSIQHEDDCTQDICKEAAAYLAMDSPNDIALTDSTTMGLGITYAGLILHKGQEILSSEQNYYSHQESIRWAAERAGGSFREVPLYQNLPEATQEEMVASIIKEVKDETRVLGLTWVHSSNGLKTPIAQIAQALTKINKNRDQTNKVLLIVDGVHGFGVELETCKDLGCDFFIAGCHKWLYGPRGTGLVAATPEAWQAVNPVIPSFTGVMDTIIKGQTRPTRIDGRQMTPGGFHSLEHRWALVEAFRFMANIGRERVYERVHQLGRLCKEGLADMPHVILHTPMEDKLSAGIISFEIRGLSVKDTVKRIVEQKVIATEAPYDTAYARFTPGIYNTPEEIGRALDVVWSLR